MHCSAIPLRKRYLTQGDNLSHAVCWDGAATTLPSALGGPSSPLYLSFLFCKGTGVGQELYSVPEILHPQSPQPHSQVLRMPLGHKEGLGFQRAMSSMIFVFTGLVPEPGSGCPPGTFCLPASSPRSHRSSSLHQAVVTLKSLDFYFPL